LGFSDGAFVFLLGLRPLPIELVSQSRRGVRLRQRVINLQGTIHCRSRFRHRLTRGNTDVLLEQQVSVGQTGVAESKIRIAFDRLLKCLERLFEPVWCALIPMITPAQIELIGLRIGCVALDQSSLVFA
jgi:hypothetical protein